MKKIVTLLLLSSILFVSGCADSQSGQVPDAEQQQLQACLLYTSPSPRDLSTSRMPSSA